LIFSICFLKHSNKIKTHDKKEGHLCFLGINSSLNKTSLFDISLIQSIDKSQITTERNKKSIGIEPFTLVFLF